jgi:hypothetical protein
MIRALNFSVLKILRFQFCIISGSFETLKKDTKYIFEMTGMDQEQILNNLSQFPWANSHRTSVETSVEETRDLVTSYFDQLTMPEKMELYEIYRPDFEMFGYDATTYLNTSSLTK